MISPPAIALSITLLLAGIGCLALGATRRKPLVRAHDPLFEANILIAYGRTHEARALLEAAAIGNARNAALLRRLAELRG